ncbi:NGG1p interacting factor 3 [Athelia psychrophila]|uniref:NGG1p interacting factor 3 n=1 Tax=Athelia psychrophila TaxID=1759441 RepID=A0A166MNC2_9AGAM|nr:NGG1p interacting factor 3 [Fibularhizoctonia sp. CBS 109695]
MAALKAVTKCMERIAPLRLAEKWDNVGILLESPVQRPNANRVLLTIDLTTAVQKEALSTSTSVIIAYHPAIFKPLSSVTLSNPLQASLLQCAANGISVYSPHTSCDAVLGGVNDWLAEGVTAGSGPSVVEILGEKKLDPTGKLEGGEGRVVKLEKPIPMRELEARIKQHLGLSQIQVGYPMTSASEMEVQTVAICAGSGGSMLLGHDADVYFTGEMAHHEILAAVAAGKVVVLCGHTNTERGYLPVLASQLREELRRLQGTDAFAAFADADKQTVAALEVHVSSADHHPLRFV